MPPTGNSAFIQDARNNIATVASVGNIYVNEAFPVLIASYHQNITAASGGTTLENIQCGKVEIQNLSGNGTMWIGGVDANAPNSGRGNELFPMSVGPQAEKILYINNTNQISVCASLSGQLVSYMAYGNGTSTTVNPATQGTAPDEIPIILSGTVPVSGSIDNPFLQTVTWDFSKPLNPPSISGLYVVTSGQTLPQTMGHLGGTVAYTSGQIFATFIPNSGQYQLSGWFIPMVDPSLQGINGLPISGGALVTGAPFQIQGPPIVSGFQPLSGTTNCSGLQAVSITFSEPMLGSTINISGIFVAASGGLTPISGTVLPVQTNTRIGQFIPNSGSLAVSTWYIPFVNTEPTDSFGNAIPSFTSGFPFQTAAAFGPDTTPPRVSGSSPASGGTNVLVFPNIMVTMSKVVQSGLVTTNTVKIHDIQSVDTNVLGATSLMSDGITINWAATPNPLSPSHLHRMELSGIQDYSLNFMTPSSGITFTTEPPLLVSSTSPASGDSAVQTSILSNIVMNRTVLPASISTNTVVIELSGIPIIGAVSLQSDSATIIFTPSPLTNLSTYTYEISGVVDSANQTFMVPYSGAGFTTVAPPLVQLYSVSTGAHFIEVGNVTNCSSAGGNLSCQVSRAGEVVQANTSPMFGRIIKQARFQLLKVGSPTGTLTCTVRDGNDTIQTTLGTINVSTIATSYTSYTFSNLNATFAMGLNSKILIEYSGGSNSSYIQWQVNTSNAYTGTAGVVYFFTNPIQYDTTSLGAIDSVSIFWA